ncbi:MAG: LuxR C-terminal-related transcriptional regulator, partial [Actinomycetia bacterium]|nr:LuxR C-terminal-related transcriptional regulator [Actinomycetes bacterium]
PHHLIVWSFAGDYRRIRVGARELERGTDRISLRQIGGLIGAALGAAEHGEPAEARRYCAGIDALLGGRDWAPFSYCAAGAVAVCTWLGGRGDEALPALRAAVTRPVATDAIVLAMPNAVEWAELAARLDRPDPAAPAELIRIAERTGVRAHWALADLTLAWTAFGSGDLPGAVAAADRAAAELERCGWAGYLARARLVAGLAEADRERAVALLRSAAAGFESCGALVRRDSALDALAKLGSQGRRAASAVAGPASLTAREREVARLAATGMSAKEIGAALFITQRTVEGHLARAYARLGVRSKVELAHRAAELGLGGART